MTSNDNPLVLDIDGVKYVVINSRIEALENSNRELHAELREIHSEIRVLTEEFRVLATRVNGINERIDDMKFYVSLAFGALAVFVGVAALIPLVSKFIQSLRKPSLTREQVSSMIDDAVSKVLINSSLPSRKT